MWREGSRLLLLGARTLQHFSSNNNTGCKNGDRDKRNQVNRFCQVVQNPLGIGGIAGTMSRMGEEQGTLSQGQQHDQGEFESIHI